MLKNHFLITLRSMMKNKLFIIINVLGMGVAIACCIVAYFAREFNANFDAVHKNHETVYRVSSMREFEGKVKRFGYAPFPLGEVVAKTIKDVDKSSRYYYSWSNFKREADLFNSNLSYVDPQFFEMFSFDFIVGSGAGLTEKTNVVVSEDMAVRLYRSPQEAFGKTITQVSGDDLKEFTISGVYKEQPMNSSFYRMNGSSYTNFDNYKDEHKGVAEDDWRNEATLFVQILDKNRVGTVYQELQGYRENNNKVRDDFQITEFTLDQLTTMGHVDRAEEVRNWTWETPPTSAIVGSSIMGVLILLIACFNLTNTAIAISSRRLKEIGIRKVMGSMRQQLIIQFIGETTFICFMALIVGVGLADLLVGGWNYLWENMRLTPHYMDNLPFMFFLVGVLFVTGVLAGSYPAFYISKFEPVSILKGKTKFGGTNMFTRTLLGLQFAISLIAIISAIGFIQNAKFQQAYDLGFNARGNVIAWLDKPGEFDGYRNAIQSNPEITSIAGARSGIFSNRDHEPVKFESKQVEVDIIAVGDNYLNTLNLTLLEGRDFRKDSETDQRESIVITQQMADEFGWDEPLGKEVLWKDTVKLFVVGVVKDVYTQGLWRSKQPLMIRYVLPDQYTQIVATTKVEHVSDLHTYMGERWSEVFPSRLYNGRLMDEGLREAIMVNNHIVYMFIFVGLIALMLSVTGLFTLVSLNIIKRTKEIGVRKVLGASVASITRIVNTEFVIILAVASIAGSVLSYFAANSLMSSIWRYYQSVNTTTFIVAICVLFIAAFATIGYKVFTAASLNPVDTLKDE